MFSPVFFTAKLGRLLLECDGTRSETRFRHSAKRTSPFKSAGASVQLTTGSRGVRVRGSNAGYTMFRGSVKSNGYPIRQFPLHFPFCTAPCPITFQLDSTTDHRGNHLATRSWGWADSTVRSLFRCRIASAKPCVPATLSGHDALERETFLHVPGTKSRSLERINYRWKFIQNDNQVVTPIEDKDDLWNFSH